MESTRQLISFLKIFHKTRLQDKSLTLRKWLGKNYVKRSSQQNNTFCFFFCILIQSSLHVSEKNIDVLTLETNTSYIASKYFFLTLPRFILNWVKIQMQPFSILTIT